MSRKTKWLLVGVVALILFTTPVTYASDNCWDDYENKLWKNWEQVEGCMTTAQESFRWYDPRKVRAIQSCSVRYISNAAQYAVEYGMCLSLDKIIKR